MMTGAESSVNPSSSTWSHAATFAHEDLCNQNAEIVVMDVDAEAAAPESPALIPGLPDHNVAMECLCRVPLPSLSGVCSSWQRLIPDPYFHSLRASRGFAADLDWVYALVQSADASLHWHAYDALARRWHDLPPPPHSMDFQFTNPGCIGFSYPVQCASTRTKLVMVAALRLKQQPLGTSDRVTLEPALEHPLVFDTLTSQWKKGSPFRVPRRWCVCGASDDKLYVVSGSGRDWDVNLAKSAEVYDICKDVWLRLTNLSSSKCSGEAINAIPLDGKLHIVSGKGVFAKVGVVYDPTSGKWTDMAPGLQAGWTGQCAAVNEKLYVLDESAGRLKVYDPDEDAWKGFMDDARLKNLEYLVGSRGKLCGIVAPSSESGEQLAGLLRFVYVLSEPARILDLPVPFGKVVAVQMLSRMHVN